MIKDANTPPENFEGGLAAIYRAVLDKISSMDLNGLGPDRLAQIATIAIKDSLGGQVFYIHKDRNESNPNRILRERRKNSTDTLAITGALANKFVGTLRCIYSIILDKAVISSLSDMSPERFAHISTIAVRESMGGQVYYIPMGLKIDREERDSKICQLWDSGAATVIELALKFQVSQQLVYEVLNRYSEKYRSTHSGGRQLRKERNAKLIACRAGGATYRQLSHDFGLDYNYVRRIIQNSAK